MIILNITCLTLKFLNKPINCIQSLLFLHFIKNSFKRISHYYESFMSRHFYKSFDWELYKMFVISTLTWFIIMSVNYFLVCKFQPWLETLFCVKLYKSITIWTFYFNWENIGQKPGNIVTHNVRAGNFISVGVFSFVWEVPGQQHNIQWIFLYWELCIKTSR